MFIDQTREELKLLINYNNPRIQSNDEKTKYKSKNLKLNGKCIKTLKRNGGIINYHLSQKIKNCYIHIFSIKTKSQFAKTKIPLNYTINELINYDMIEYIAIRSDFDDKQTNTIKKLELESKAVKKDSNNYQNDIYNDNNDIRDINDLSSDIDNISSESTITYISNSEKCMENNNNFKEINESISNIFETKGSNYMNNDHIKKTYISIEPNNTVKQFVYDKTTVIKKSFFEWLNMRDVPINDHKKLIYYNKLSKNSLYNPYSTIEYMIHKKDHITERLSHSTILKEIDVDILWKIIKELKNEMKQFEKDLIQICTSLNTDIYVFKNNGIVSIKLLKHLYKKKPWKQLLKNNLNDNKYNDIIKGQW